MESSRNGEYLSAEKASQWWDDLTDKDKANVCKYYRYDEYDTDRVLSHGLGRWLIAEPTQLSLR